MPSKDPEKLANRIRRLRFDNGEMTQQEDAVDTETKQSELIAPDIGTAEVPKEHFHLLIGILALLVGALWLLPFGSSLWLDETGTFWIVQGSFGQTIHRALESSGSIPYFVVVWLAKTIGVLSVGSFGKV